MSQQQNSSGDQTILRFSHLSRHGNRSLSHAGKTSRTRINPQILLRRLIFELVRKSIVESLHNAQQILFERGSILLVFFKIEKILSALNLGIVKCVVAWQGWRRFQILSLRTPGALDAA